MVPDAGFLGFEKVELFALSGDFSFFNPLGERLGFRSASRFLGGVFANVFGLNGLIIHRQ